MQRALPSLVAIAVMVLFMRSTRLIAQSPNAVADAWAVAPDKSAKKDSNPSPKLSHDNPERRAAEIEAELNNQFDSIDFTGQPLNEVLNFIHDKHPLLQFELDGAALKDAGIDATTTLVTIRLQDVRLKTILERLLTPFNLGYRIHDGLMIISTRDKLDATLETRIYNCRDILAADTGRFRHPFVDQYQGKQIPAAEKPAAIADSSPAESQQRSVPNNDSNSHASAATAPKDGANASTQPRTPASDLLEIITTSVSPQTWTQSGGPGTISEYDGLLVISTTAAAHSEVADLLDKLGQNLQSRSPK